MASTVNTTNNGIIHCYNVYSNTNNCTNYTTTTTMLLINQVSRLPLQRKPLLGPGGIELTLSTDDDDSQMVHLSSPTPDSPTTCDTWSDASSSELARSPRETADLKCRAFACTQCPLSFHRNHDLRRHQRSVHGIERKSFVCRVCLVKSFPRPDSVTRHERTCRGLLSPAKQCL
ncbi:hypothetical protein BJ741DRAFT_595567 [Chytriomyces cf. hyalinus JEL632]|nr:hypothetical protein BJ741DRAFT_595567 [Chytriomyces cf. hyalinus JEL632]